MSRFAPTVCLIIVTILAASPAPAQRNDVRAIRLRVNGRGVELAAPGAQVINGRILVPLREVLERLGAHVEWEASSRTVIARRGDLELLFPIGSRIVHVDGRPVRVDFPALLLDDRAVASLPFYSQTLGARVRWAPEARTIDIWTSDDFAALSYGVRLKRFRLFFASW